MSAVRCPTCGARIAERDGDGRVVVRRDGQVVAIDPRVVCCRDRRCAGFVEPAYPAVSGAGSFPRRH